MKFIFELSSRTNLSETAEVKHQRVVEALNNILLPWGLSNVHIPFPGFDESFVSILPISKYMTSGIKFTIFYRYRNMLDDDSRCDDRIFIEFNPKKVNFSEFTNSVILKYVDFFKAYRVILCNEDLMYTDFDKIRNINFRKTIHRFYPTCFFDEILCKQALGMSCSEIKKKLHDHVNITCVNNGIFFNNSDKFPTEEESNEFDKMVWNLIKG